jgi:hypothetical protein
MRTRSFGLATLLLAIMAIGVICAVLAWAEDPPAATGGTVTGILTAKGTNWIEVKADGASNPERYFAFWRGGNPDQGGGPDPVMVKTISKLVVPNRVKVTWKMDERRRIVSVETLAPPTKEGTLTGAVVAKGETWVDVKTPDGAVQRFWPRWLGGMPAAGGGFDKDMIRAIAGIPIGATVKITWKYDERLRALGIERV